MVSESPNRVGERRSECLPLGLVRPQPETQAEIAVRSGLRGLRQRRHDQRMARVDRHHRGTHAKARHRRADEAGQRDRVVVELLREPDLPHSGLMGVAGLLDHIVDDVGGVRSGGEDESGRHTATNRWWVVGYSDGLRLSESLALDRAACHHTLAQTFGRDVEHHLLRPTDEERGNRRREIENDVEPHPRPVLAHRSEVVLDVLTPLLNGFGRVPDHPVVAPVVFEEFLVSDAHDPKRRLDVVRSAVRIAIQDFGVFVHRRPRRYVFDVGQRLHDHIARSLEDHLSGCANSHSGK